MIELAKKLYAQGIAIDIIEQTTGISKSEFD